MKDIWLPSGTGKDSNLTDTNIYEPIPYTLDNR